MVFTTQDNESIVLEFVVMVDNLDADNTYYNVHLAGGQHVTIKESFKSRASFIGELP